MDDPIFSRQTMRERGARAFDQGRGVNDHHMNEGAPAIADWQAGWRERRTATFAKQLVKPIMAQVCPP